MNIRNAEFGVDLSIDCEVEIGGAWVPYTAREDDVEAFGRRVYAAALDLPPAPYVAPDPVPGPTEAEQLEQERAGMACSKFQAKAALLEAGLLDDAEAAVSASSRLTQIAWADAVQFNRNSPMIATLAGPDGLNLTDAEVDGLFRTAMDIEA